MPRKKLLRLLVGLRVRDPASAPACRAAAAVLEEAASLEPALRVPLHWNLPLRPLAESGSRKVTELVTEIKARVRTRADSVLPLGYCGAPHPLLKGEELERELAWCRRNPWKQGFKTLTGQEPAHILPTVPDLLREETDGVYSRQGFRSLGVALPWHQALRLFPKRGSYRFRLGEKAGRAIPFAALVLSAPDGPASPDWQRLAVLVDALGTGDQPLFLLFDLDASQGQPLLGSLLQAIGGRHVPMFLSLEGDDLFAHYKDSQPTPPSALLAVSDPLVMSGPLAREGTARAEPLRAKRRRRTDADLKSILQAMTSSAAGSRSRGRAGAEGGDQVLIAAMTGLVSLDGPKFAAAFADGRFSGLQRRGSRLGCGLPAESSLTLAGRRYSLQTESAFSFERDGETGLRTVLKARLPNTDGELRLLADAYFRDGEDDLELDFTLIFPDFSTPVLVEEIAPFELPLFSLGRGERARVTVTFNGEASYTETFAAEAGERLLYGSRFLFSEEGNKGTPALSLAPGPPGASGVLPLPLRVVSRRGRHLLLANPFGSYLPLPLAVYSSRTERFSLRLGLAG